MQRISTFRIIIRLMIIQAAFLIFIQSDFPAQNKRTNKKAEARKMNLQVNSTAFENGGMIPSQYTCDGLNISPPLSWQTEAEGIKTFVLICEDPDAPAGTWLHWLMYNIPADVRSLPEEITATKNLPGSVSEGTNDFSRIGYGGPCPPSGTHRYFFKIYALDTVLQMDSGASKKEVMNAIQGHIIVQGELMGKYTKK